MNLISNKAKIGKNLKIGAYTVIKDDVEIGDNVQIANNVVIYEGSKIGDNVRIDDNVVIGKQPLRAVNSIFQNENKEEPAIIEDNCLIGTSAVIYANSRIEKDVLIADLATVRENVSIGTRTIIGRNVTIENKSQIGSNCKLETNSYISAYSSVDDYAFIAPGVVTTNDNFLGRTKERFKHFQGVSVKKGGRIGANATILPGKTINIDTVVAAGSLVTKDTPPKKIVMGSPARIYKTVPREQLLENQDK
ncbi:DapH/DapD/GlmU-related protein [Natronospora cellulosivora (SeqCode)]